MYRYETHLHARPVSRCARADVRENLTFYKELGYAGVFLTDHFLDGSISVDQTLPYEEKIEFFFLGYEEAKEIGREIGLKVFSGTEISYKGTDFLIYGLDKEWYLEHPQIMQMPKSEELALMMDHGALIIQAHPYREASYINHIRLFPRQVHGVEVYNACRTDAQNEMARLYADHYHLVHFAGSDNHVAGKAEFLGGMESDTPIKNEADFVTRVKCDEMKPFACKNPLYREQE